MTGSRLSSRGALIRGSSISRKQHATLVLAAASVVAGMAGYASRARAASIVSNETNPLNTGTSWINGVAPGTTDTAVWNSTSGGAFVGTLGGPLAWGEIQILNPGGAISLANDGNTLTLEGLGATPIGIDLSAATQNLTLNNALILGATQQWNVAAGRSITDAGTLTDSGSGFGLTLNGGGTVAFSQGAAASVGFTGPLAIQGAMVSATFTAATTENNVLSTTAIQMAGGTLSILNSAATANQTDTQVFSTTTITGAGPSTISSNRAGSSSNLNVQLGALTRQAGGVGGTINIAPVSSRGYISTTTTGTNGIVGGWAIYNSSDFAETAGAGTNPTGVVHVNDTWASTNNTAVTLGTNTIAAGSTTNSLAFRTATPATVTLAGTGVVSSGGLLMIAADGAIADKITGGTLEGAAGQDLVINQYDTTSGATFEIDSTIANNTTSTALTKTGGGVAIIGGANTFTGGVYLNQGVLQLGAGGNLNSQAVTFPNVSTGTLRLAGNPLTVASVSTAVVGSTAPIIENNNAAAAALTLATSGTSTFAGTVQNGAAGGALNVVMSGAGTQIFSGTNTYAGTTTINSGTLAFPNSLASSNVIVNPGATLDVSGMAAGYTVAAGKAVSGAGNVLGSLNVTSGTLAPGAALTGTGALSVPAVTLGANALLNYSFGASTNGELAVTNNGGLTINGGSFNLFQAGTTLPFDSNGVYQLITYSGAIGGTGSSLFTQGSILNAVNGITYSFSNDPVNDLIDLTISGNNSIQSAWSLDTSGNWSDASKWTAGVPTNPGDVATFGSAILAPRTVTLDTNETVAAVIFKNANAYTIAGSNTLTFDNGATTAAITDSLGSHTISANLKLNSNLAVSVANATDSLTISGPIATNGNSNAITMSGLGTLVLSGSNSYTGGTNLNGGTVNFKSDGNLGSGAVTFNGGTLQWASGTNSDVSALPVTFAVTATLDTNGNNVTLANAIGGSGTGGLIKAGAGTLNLAAANTYSGTNTVNAGSLAIAGDASLGTAPGSAITDLTFNPGTNNTAGFITTASTSLNVNRNISLSSGLTTFDNGGNVDSVNGIISGPGSLNAIGAGSLTLNAANTFTGTTTIANGNTLVLGVPLALQGSTLNYNNQGGTLSFGSLTAASLGALSGGQSLVLTNASAAGVALTVGGNGGATTFSGALSGAGATLTKSGAGTMVIAGPFTYTGSTTDSSGTLYLTGGGSIQGGAANVGNGAGAQLLINGGSLTASAASTVGTGGGNGFLLQAGSAAFNGGLSSVQNTDGYLIEVTSSGTAASTLSASSLSLGRSANLGATQPTAGTTNAGFYVNGANATINITGAFNIGTGANSSASARIDAGSMTVGGTTTIAEPGTPGRWSVLDINGGTFTSNDTTGAGILIGGGGQDTDELLIRAGTLNTNKVTFGSTSQTAGMDVLNVTGGTLNVGAGGLILGGNGAYTSTVTFGTATVGALADWSTTLPVQLTSTAGTTFLTTNSLGAGHNITLGGVVSGTGNLIVSGTGSLNLAGASNYTGNTTVNAGTLILSSPTPVTLSGAVANAATLSVTGTASLGPISGAGVTNVASTGSLSTAQLIQSSLISNGSTSVSGTGSLGAISGLGSLNIGAAGNVALTETQSTSSIGALNLTGNGTFDVTNNALLINYSAAGQTSPDAAIRSALISGSGTNGVTYNGVGIISSTAARLNAALVANNGTPAYGVGYADGSDPYLNNEGPAAGVEEVKLTLLGDLNLDGFVNSADFILFANSFGKTGGTAAAWDHGDLNYDGSVNSADFILFADEFGKGLGTVSSTDGGLTLAQGGLDAAQVQQFNQIGTDLGISSTELAQLDLKVAAVPEPASLGLLVIGGLGLMGRRRRRNA